MSKISRIALVCGVFMLIVGLAVSSAPAQRRGSNYNQGGNNQNNNNQNNNQNNNNSNKNKDKDNDDNDGNKNSQSNNQQNNNQNNNNQNNNNSNNNNSNNNKKQGGKNSPNNNQNSNQNVQQLQDMLKNGQKNNNNNNNPQNQYQNSQQFPGNKNNKQYQNGQQNGQQGGLQIGNVQVGDWQKNNWQGSHKIEYWNKQYNNGPQPFSAKWYDNHPNAWYYNHPHSDVWVVATIPGVYSWLGWGNNYPQGYVYDNSQPFNPDAYGEWYPLGVYSMVTGPGDNGTRIVQLSVDRQGNINGTYYDLVMDTSRQVSGRIRQSSQTVSWSLNSNPQLTFRAPLNELMQPQGVVTVQLPGGEQEWQLIRLQNN